MLARVLLGAAFLFLSSPFHPRAVASQTPLTVSSDHSSLPLSPSQSDTNTNTMVVDWMSDDFVFKSGQDIFTPKDLVELPRPGPGAANFKGDLALVSVSTYSFKDKKCVNDYMESFQVY